MLKRVAAISAALRARNTGATIAKSVQVEIRKRRRPASAAGNAAAQTRIDPAEKT
jgi:hypothetical protein